MADKAREKLNSHVKKRMSSPATNQTKKVKRVSKKSDTEDSEAKQDETSREKTHEKNHKPDMLTTIINQKKLSLMKDREIVEFLKKFATQTR